MKRNEKYSPLVSVVIPTRNRSCQLKQALDSVLLQTYPNIEIIVADDASTDDTKELLTSYVQSYMNLRILRNNVHHGPCRSRNKGIQAAQGEMISFLDDDDEWLPQRLTILVRSFNSDFAYICSNYWTKNRNNYTLHRLPKRITYQDMLYLNRTGNTVLALTDHVRAIGGFDENLASRQDYDLWLRLLENTTNKLAQVVPQPLHIINKSNDDRLSASAQCFKGKKRFYLKHRKKMNTWQRRFHRMQLRKHELKRITWKDRLCNIIVRKRLKYFNSK